MTDNRFPGFPVDNRFPGPGSDARFPTPGADAQFPAPGVDTRFSGDIYGGSALALATFARASTATLETNGVWAEVASGVRRQTPLGLLIEGASTNHDANPRCEGAVVSGALPTGWTVVTAASGITATVTAVGLKVNGVDCIRLRLTGTAAQAQHTIGFQTPEASPAAVSQQALAHAVFIRRVGNPNGVTAFRTSVVGRASNNALVAGAAVTSPNAAVGTTLTRVSMTGALPVAATVAKVQHQVGFLVTVGTVVDEEVEIGWPQMEIWPVGQTPLLTTPILPPVGAPAVSTRAAETLTGGCPATASLAVSWTPATLVGGQRIIEGGSGSNRAGVFVEGGKYVGRSTSGGVSAADVIVADAATDVRRAVGVRLNGTGAAAALARGVTEQPLGAIAAPVSTWHIGPAYGVLRDVTVTEVPLAEAVDRSGPAYDRLPIEVVIAYGQSRADNRAEGTQVCYLPTVTARYPETALMGTQAARPGMWFERVWDSTQFTRFEPFRDCPPTRTLSSPPNAAAGQFPTLGQSMGSILWWMQDMDTAAGRPVVPRVYLAAGVGGASIDELRDGGSNFTAAAGNFNGWSGRFIPAVTDMADAAERLYGRRLVVRHVLWLQGERDGLLGTPAATYKAHLLQLIGDVRTQVPAITGQTEPIDFIMDFVPAQGTGQANPIAFVQAEVARENVDGRTWSIGPCYWQQFRSNAHMSLESTVLHAERFARAIDQLKQGLPVGWLRVTNYSVAGSVITITTSADDLVFDELTVPAQANKGFVLASSAGTTITGVALAGNQIVVSLNQAMQAGDRLEYAFSGPGNGGAGPVAGAWGNIRTPRAIVSNAVPGQFIYDFLETWQGPVA